MNRVVLLLAIVAVAAIALFAWPQPMPPLDLPDDVGAPATTPVVAQPMTGATAADFEPGAAPIQRVADAAPSTLTDLLVRVRGSDGAWRRDVMVLVSPLVAADPWLEDHRAVTDRDGTAHLRLPAGRWRCRTAAGGEALAAFGPGEHAEVTIELPAGIELRVRVVDDNGQPLAEAEVLAVDRASAARAHPLAATAADGWCTLRDLQPGSYLSARHRDHAPSAPQFVDPATAARGELTITLRRDHGRVRCLVVDVGNRPVDGAIVVLGADETERAAGDGRTAPPMQHGMTGPDGRVASAPLAPGRITVQASRPGVGFGRTAFVVASRDDAEVVVQLRPAAKVTGIARDHSGAPMAGVYVWNAPLRAFGCRLAMTGADGSYALDDVPTGRAELHAQLPPGPPTSIGLDLGEGRSHEWNPELDDRPTGSITGRVVDAQNLPLVGWRVVATPAGESAGNGAETAADGGFEVRNLLRGTRARLTVRRPSAGWTGFPDAVREDVSVDGEPVVIVIAKDQSGARLRGRIVGDDGVGLQASLLLQHASAPHVASYPTASDGTFAIDGVPAGQLRIDVEADGYPRLRLAGADATAGSELDLGTVRLPRGGTVSGSIRDVQQHEPQTATITILDPGGRDVGAATVTAGSYATPLLPPGEYAMLVQAENCAGGRIPVTVTAGQDLQMNLELAIGVPLRLEVADRVPEHATAMASIGIYDRDGKVLWWAHDRMQNGVVTFPVWLAPGPYTLLALGIDGYRQQHRFDVEAGGGSIGAVVRIELQPQ